MKIGLIFKIRFIVQVETKSDFYLFAKADKEIVCAYPFSCKNLDNFRVECGGQSLDALDTRVGSKRHPPGTAAAAITGKGLTSLSLSRSLSLSLSCLLKIPKQYTTCTAGSLR